LGNHGDKEIQKLSTLGEKMKNIHSSDLDHFLTLFLPIERKYSKGLKDADIIVLEKDSQYLKKELPIKVCVILDSLRSSFNVGSIFRVSDCIGISEIYLCGYTAIPSEENKDVIKTTMGSHDAVAWSYRKNIYDLVMELKQKKFSIVAMETVLGSNSIYQQDFSLFPNGGDEGSYCVPSRFGVICKEFA